MAQPSAEDFKNTGNRYYQEQRYHEAIDAYGKAIIKNSQVATYFTNRALCYIQLKQWDHAVEDCRKAADIDRKSVKAWYFWGRASINLCLYDEAIKLLTKANELANGQKVNFGDDITGQLRLARREKFVQEEERRITQEIELQSYLNKLIDDDLAHQLDSLVSTTFKSEEEQSSDTVQAYEDLSDDLRAESQKKKDELNNLFKQVDERRRRREIPDYLCGKISFELLSDPVITPSGITYDRQDIKEHLQRVGHFDPVTRAPLSEDQLIPNLAMREVVENFIAENQWALHEDAI